MIQIGWQDVTQCDLADDSVHSYDIHCAGTIVSGKDDGSATVKGFATIDHVCLINIEGTGMVGVPGIASAVFSTVRDAGVNVIMISQASSEHSICFAVKAR